MNRECLGNLLLKKYDTQRVFGDGYFLFGPVES
jgi:hypothetical protein